uniref:FXNA-like protease n=1 Tax=Ornithodoros turicata TaxID=34597 RepID=A0A2R5LGK1_9ACAR
MAGAMQDGVLRFRQKGSNGVHNSHWNGTLEEGAKHESMRRRHYLLSGDFYFYLLLFYIISACAAHYAQNTLPDAVREVPGNQLGRTKFIGKRAKNFLVEIVSLGPRSVGSYENEVAAVDIIQRQLTYIESQADPVHFIESDVQRANGSFYLDFIDGFTSSYRAVKNVVVRLSPKENASSAGPTLLLNCHYDSAPTSPGASDDAISCAILMEILQVLSKRPTPLPHPIIFLFNGAEENILQGSHGFITQHKWAKDVKAFVNLEACGAGGKELLFQASSGDPWLVRAYVEGAVRPFGSIVAEEIFRSGVILSDTDFRIFRDFGHIPGLDFAFAKNGYVYHTKYDNMDYIEDGSIQHAGDNILGLVTKILEAPEFATDLPRTNKPRAVYFDFMCIFMVTYSYPMGNLLAKLAIAITFISLAWRIKKAAPNGNKHGMMLVAWCRARALGVILASMVAGVLTSVAVALVLTLFGSTMSWYARPYLTIGLYYCSCVGTMLAVHWRIALSRRKERDWEDGEWTALEHYQDANQLLWIAALVVLMASGVNGIYIPIAWVVFAGTVFSAASIWFLRLGKQGQHGWLVLIVIVASVIPLLLTICLSMNIEVALFPIMGRIGTLTNPEIVAAVICSFHAIFCTSYMIPFVHVSSNGSRLVYVLLGVCAISMATAVSPLGFPYSAANGRASPQRILFFNVERTFHNQQQERIGEDSGIWAVPLDYNGPRSLKQVAKGRKIAKVDCTQHIYCGMPYYFPVISKLRETYYIDAPGPIFHRQRKFQLVSQKAGTFGTRRLTFNLTGPTHMGMTLSPRKGVNLSGWSFTRGPVVKGHPWDGGRPTYFVYLSQGEDLGPWEFWIDLDVPTDRPSSEPIVDLGYYTYYMQQNDHRQMAFQLFLKELPDWIHPTPWAASADFYIF